MITKSVKHPIDIVGIKITTANDTKAAFEDIPQLWQKVMREKLLDPIAHKASEDIYALYTDYQDRTSKKEDGRYFYDNRGSYSYIIGVPVTSVADIPAGYTHLRIAPSDYYCFEVEKESPQMVGKKWQEIWRYPFEIEPSYNVDFEQYHPDGTIDIFIGVSPQ